MPSSEGSASQLCQFLMCCSSMCLDVLSYLLIPRHWLDRQGDAVKNYVIPCGGSCMGNHKLYQYYVINMVMLQALQPMAVQLSNESKMLKAASCYFSVVGPSAAGTGYIAFPSRDTCT